MDDALNTSVLNPACVIQTVTVCSDSQASLHLLRRLLYWPETLRESIHLDLLLKMRDNMLRCRLAGIAITLAKVKAHTGVYGNEKADEGAAAALRDDADHDYEETADNESRHNLAWPARWVTHGDDRRTHDFANLTAALKHHIAPLLGKGFFKPTTLTSYWTTTAADLDEQVSNATLWDSSLPFHHALSLFKARWGALWTPSSAAHYNRPYVTPAPSHLRRQQRAALQAGHCPLCSNTTERANTTHILSKCTFFTRSYINRHNQAVQTIFDTLVHAPHEPMYAIVDASSVANLPAAAHATRLPPWLLSDAALIHGQQQGWFQQAWPDDPPPDLRNNPVALEVTRRRLRPDILLVRNLTDADLQHLLTRPDALPFHARQQWEIAMIEVGYTTELHYADAVQHKQRQHTVLHRLLHDPSLPAGHRWMRPHTSHPITFMLGTMASIPKSLHTSLQRLHVSPLDTSLLATQLSRTAANSSTHLLHAYRHAIARCRDVPVP